METVETEQIEEQKDTEPSSSTIRRDTEDDAAGNSADYIVDELKGVIFFETLGGLPLKVGILIVVLYHITYLYYKAYFETRVDNAIEDDCFCSRRDQIVYRTITFVSMGVWVLFLLGYGVYRAFECFTCTGCFCCKSDKSEDHQRIKAFYEKYNQQVLERKKYFQKEMNDMITTYYLDPQHYNSKKEKLERTRGVRKNLKQVNEVDELNEVDAKLNTTSWKNWCLCTKHCCFMFFKIIFISIRFAFRLAIVPLLQLHWLNNYAWTCIFNNLLREYCATVVNEYFIGLDHSLVVYIMYVLLVLAILFTIIIEWFPRGIPNFIMKFEGNFNSLTIDIDSGKKQQVDHTK